MMRQLILATLAAALAGVFSGCLDTTPLQESPLPRSDAGSDALEDPACRACLSSAPAPGCKPTYDSCIPIKTCNALLSCLFERACLQFPDINQRLDCGFPCVDEAMITSGTDPAIVALTELNKCSLEECRAACVDDPLGD